MTNERVSFVCRRSAELRKGKSVEEMPQSLAMRLANEEWRRRQWSLLDKELRS